VSDDSTTSFIINGFTYYAVSPFTPEPFPSPAGSSGPGNAQWAISDFRLTQNGRDLYAPLFNVDLDLNSCTVDQEFVYPLYSLGLLTSEYKSATKLYAFLAQLIQPNVDLMACLNQMDEAFSLNTPPVGVQLDLIGQVVGVSRTLPFVPVAPYYLNLIGTSENSGSLFVYTNVGAVPLPVPLAIGQEYTIANMTNATWLNGATLAVSAVNSPYGIPGNTWSFVAPYVYPSYSWLNDVGGTALLLGGGVPFSPVLSDPDYLTLIIAKIARNQWNGEVAALYALWTQLFPGTYFTFLDGGLIGAPMTATVIYGGTLSTMQQQMLINDMILPRPQGVLYTYINATELPLLGFGQENSLISGLGAGHFV